MKRKVRRCLEVEVEWCDRCKCRAAAFMGELRMVKAPQPIANPQALIVPKLVWEGYVCEFCRNVIVGGTAVKKRNRTCRRKAKRPKPSADNRKRMDSPVDAGLDPIVMNALVGFFGNPAVIPAKIKAKCEGWQQEHGTEAVVRAIERTKAAGDRWGSIGMMLGQIVIAKSESKREDAQHVKPGQVKRRPRR